MTKRTRKGRRGATLRRATKETDTIPEFLRGLTRGLMADLHVVLPYGWNDHHKAEAIFKADGKSFKLAASRDGRYRGLVPSTKGVLE